MPDVQHSTLSGDELHQPFHYVQSADPGAAGAGKWWLDTTDAAAPVLRQRNAANTAWVLVADSAAVAAAAAHVAATNNPHGVTKAQVGLGSVPDVDATARANHTGTQSADTITDGSFNKVFTSGEQTKLGSIEVSATRNQADAYLLARGNHTGTQSLDTTTDSAARLAMTAAERSKLAGIAAGATANDSDANLRNRATHTGTQSADTITDGTVNKAFSAADDAKLAGIASGATANSPDAVLLNRANHTGTQDAATIASGVIAPARLGSGTPGPLTFLRGDGFWSEIAGGGGGGGFEQGINAVVSVDDFMGGINANGSVGSLGWLASQATLTYATPPDASFRGTVEVASLATSGASGRVFLQGFESLGVDLDVLFRARTGPSVASTTSRIGISNTWNGQPGSGFYVESLSSDATWYAVCRNGGVQTRVNTGASSAANTTVKVRFRKIGSTVLFNLNDGADIAIGTNVPSGTGLYGVQVIPGTSSSRSMFLDYFHCIASNTGR